MKDLLRRLFLVDLLKGMWLTFRYQAPKNIYTEQYPLERPMVAERYRGAPRLNMNPETGESLCIACNLCALACPENLIVVGWLLIQKLGASGRMEDCLMSGRTNCAPISTTSGDN